MTASNKSFATCRALRGPVPWATRTVETKAD